MELSTYSQEKALDLYEENKKYKDIRKFKPKRLEDYVSEDYTSGKKGSQFSIPQSLTIENDEKEEIGNVLLDMSLRSLFEDFILVWNKIIIDLFSESLYKNLYDSRERKKDWWELFYRRLVRIVSVFWVKDRILHVGVGLIIASFFMYFIFVTQ